MGRPILSSDMRRRSPGREAGYNLVALVVLLVVLNIAVAAVLPLWSSVVRRTSASRPLIASSCRTAMSIHKVLVNATGWI